VHASYELMADVLALLPSSPDRGIAAAWAYKLLGRGTLTGVRQALNALVESRLAASVHHTDGRAALYYQAPPPAAQPKQLDLIDFIQRSAP
jgi:hypothetical protein